VLLQQSHRLMVGVAERAGHLLTVIGPGLVEASRIAKSAKREEVFGMFRIER
jgi:hypothetical protein